MTLPVAPQCWDIADLTVDRTQAVASFGFTERQARFLVTVMLHSGVFVERQYCAFAGIVHGQKTHDFLARLTTAGMAKAIAVGPLHRGPLFHIHHKPLCAAIGQTDNRHRKPMSTARMIERLMVLDAVLGDRTFTWLNTEFDSWPSRACTSFATRSVRTWRCVARRRGPFRSSPGMRICPRRSATCTCVRQRPRTRFDCWTDARSMLDLRKISEIFWTRDRRRREVIDW